MKHFFYIFFLIYKNANWILLEKQRKSLKRDSQNKKRQYTREKYQNLSEKEKNKKHQYTPEKYQNLSEEEKKSKNIVANAKKVCSKMENKR